MGEEGSQALLKALNSSSSLENVCIDKAQISLRTKRQIECKMRENREIRDKQRFLHLKKENRKIKEKDEHTWDDLDTFEMNIANSDKQIRTLANKVNSMTYDLESQKEQLNKYLLEKQQQEKELESTIKANAKKSSNLLIQCKGRLKLIEEKHDNTKHGIEIENDLIGKLEKQVQEECLKNRKLENDLEDYYNNHKYINKKK